MIRTIQKDGSILDLEENNEEKINKEFENMVHYLSIYQNTIIQKFL